MLIGTMKKIWMYLLLPTLFAVFSCEKENPYFSIDCDYCYDIKPDSGELVITLSLDDEYKYVPVTVYKGPIEDGVEAAFIDSVSQADLYDSKLYIWVKLDEYYSVTAEYIGKNGFGCGQDKNLQGIQRMRVHLLDGKRWLH